MSAFIHLHTHSEFSLSDSILRVNDLVSFAKEQQAEAIALTDRNNLYGAIKFYKKARAEGIKPIIGCDLTVRDKNGDCNQLILLAQNNAGLIHLYELVSFAYLQDHVGGDVAVNIERFTPEQCTGLIALSGGLEGDIGRAIFGHNFPLAQEKAAFWQGIFGDRYYLQIACHGKAEERDYITACQQIGEALQIPAVATNLACFPQAEDFDVHEIRVCIAGGYQLEDQNRPHFFNNRYYLTTAAEMAEIFQPAPQLLANSHIIAQRCNVTLTLGKNYLPDFPVPEGTNVEDFLIAEAKKGLEERLEFIFPNPEEREEKRSIYDERLATELKIINQMGFPGYFLIVADFIQWAKEQQIPVGPGRGSGAGSLVAYALKITDLDPLIYNLFFERFLNPERVSMPDFDIDFCVEGRDRVIEYVAQKYGKERVSQIATHGTMAAKAVIRDVGRVLGMPYGQVDKISKAVTNVPGIGLKDALGWSEKSKTKPELFSADLKRYYDSDADIQEMMDIALKLEGLARNVGKHAGGVVIAPTKLTDFSALYCEQVGAGVATQYDKDDVEAVGLVKFDFLGLRNLTVINDALQLINARHAKEGKPPLQIEALPLDDKATYDLLHAAKTTAVFQLESGGMKGILTKMQPDTFEDIIALVALFRPGPLGSGMVDDFINRKHGRAEVVYPHPDLEEELKTTYGVMVYQEQVMKVAQILANYTLGEADNLRRAMGKKKPAEMARNKDIFVSRAVERGGIDAQKAKEIFELIEKFAEYGFNKSHSAAYALISYQTAYLKAHYPAELMAAVLTSEMEKIDKIVRFVNEARDMGLTIISPCVNRSEHQFTVNEQGEIVYGLGAVKGVGENAAKVIIAERKKNGKFTSLTDLCQRLDLKKLNKKTLETLICSGSFDFLGENRGALLATLPEAIKLAEQHHKNTSRGQGDMFGLFGIETNSGGSPVLQLDPKNNWDNQQILQHEKQTLGLFLSAHPIDDISKDLKALCHGLKINEWLELVERKRETTRGKLNLEMTVAGVVVDVRGAVSKKQGKEMLFITLDDGSERIEVSIFGENVADFKPLCQQDNVLIVQCSAEYLYYSEQWRFSAIEIYDFYEKRFSLLESMTLTCPSEDPKWWSQLGDILLAKQQLSGVKISVALQVADIKAQGNLVLPQFYQFDRDSFQQLEIFVGQENICCQYLSRDE